MMRFNRHYIYSLLSAIAIAEWCYAQEHIDKTTPPTIPPTIPPTKAFWDWFDQYADDKGLVIDPLLLDEMQREVIEKNTVEKNMPNKADIDKDQEQQP